MTDLTLYLLRHGESVANVSRVFAAKKVDPPLGDCGTSNQDDAFHTYNIKS